MVAVVRAVGCAAEVEGGVRLRGAGGRAGGGMCV